MVCQNIEAMKILLTIMKSKNFTTISFEATGINIATKCDKDQNKYFIMFVIQTQFRPLP